MVRSVRLRFHDPEFMARHRRSCNAFQRQRVLTFPVVMLMILQKSVKSIHRHLGEFLDQWAGGLQRLTASKGAWTQARAKLSHTAFIELNTQVVLASVYAPEHESALQRWQGRFLTATDSSLARMPHHPDLARSFEQVQSANQHGGTGTYYQGRVSVLYDVLNRVGRDARICSSAVGEVELAREHWLFLRPEDVLVFDRGYTGYEQLARLTRAKRDFIGRCSKGSFASVQTLFARNEAGLSVRATLRMPPDKQKEWLAEGLPREITVRLVTVRLSTGELEVLVTSLLEERAYPTESFAQAYHGRWGIETYYHQLKSHLDLENWSGQTEEAIRQDFHAAVFLCNVESLVSAPAQVELTERTAQRKQPAQINRADGLHALKLRVIELFARERPVDELVAELIQVFRANPTAQRPDRQVPRRTASMWRSYNFQRHVKKYVF
mgnify:CR=1 FL=1